MSRDLSNFIVVGENIHCTRIVKANGARTKQLPGGGVGVVFKHKGAERILPTPADWGKKSPSFNEGKIKHIALAVHLAMDAAGEEKAAGEDYLCWAAERQIATGARFLDVNVDEYTNDPAERARVMGWLASFIGSRFNTPLSIDSSNTEVLVAGLEACRKEAGTPMVNSVSLEREEAVEVVARFKCHAIVSAAGKTGLPCATDDRLENFSAIVEKLEKKGVERAKMHLDPLVFPISVDPTNGKSFLEAVAATARKFPGVNLNGGLSNISFGMPERKLINMVFMYLFSEAGGNGGIIDPVSTPAKEVGALDPDSEGFKLAQDVLTGEDMYGAEYIAAFREGRLK